MRLKKIAVPHIFSWSKQPTPAAMSRKERAKKRLKMDTESQAAWRDVAAEEIIDTEHCDTPGISIYMYVFHNSLNQLKLILNYHSIINLQITHQQSISMSHRCRQKRCL